jgi:toluene monooxygenase system ferredoxin subunit
MEKRVTVSKLCRVSDLQRGEMASFQADGRDVLVVWPEAGAPSAFDDRCPHQGISLSDGYLDEAELVCAAHQWTFDAQTGAGIDPPGCDLTRYPLRIEGDDVFVDLGA